MGVSKGYLKNCASFGLFTMGITISIKATDFERNLGLKIQGDNQKKEKKKKKIIKS